MRLFDLSLRFKLPLWGAGLIIATALALSSSFVYQAWESLNDDLLKSTEDLGRSMAYSLHPVLLHDDVWGAFKVVTLPFAANPGTVQTDHLIVLDKANRVYVSSHPEDHPVLTPLANLGPDFQALDSELPMAAESPIFVRNAVGAERIYVAIPIANDGLRLGTLILGYRKSLLWQRFLHLLRRAAWLTLLVLAVLLPVTAYWGRRMMLPMRLVTERIKRVGSGELQPLKPGLYPYQDEVGQLFLAYGTLLSQLQEKAGFEREMVKSERMAAVGRLTACIAHEINNPLGGMLNAISTLKRHGNPDEITQKTVSLLERGLSQIRETVSALLVEAKVKSRPIDASDLEDVHILIAPAAHRQGTQVSWTVTLPDSLALPSTMVRQVLINLLLNAIAAAGRAGQVALRLTTREQRLIMIIENSGLALLPAQMERLFEPFTSFSENGNGLGLWICYQIVTQLGGTIHAESNAGLTRFTVILPLDSLHVNSFPPHLPD